MNVFTYSRIHVFTLILTLSLFPSLVNSQSKGEPVEQIYIECGTPDSPDEVFESRPWYGNNAILPSYTERANEFILNHLSDSVSAQTRDDFSECFLDIEAIVMVPIQFWIYLEEESPSFPSQEDLQIAMDNLNNTFYDSGMNVRFYMQCPEYILDNDALVRSHWGNFWNQFGGNNTRAFAINVHIIVDVEGSGGTYYQAGDYIVVERNIYDESNRTLAHEVGHYFGLDHTHRNFSKGKCRQEAVDRNRNYGAGCIFKYGKICERSGDGFCDTPAEPSLSNNTLYDRSNCTYIANETDNWGDRYLPNDGSNIMSYAGTCRRDFTGQQIAAMWYQIFHVRPWIINVDLDGLDPDKYEPDDSDEFNIPREITIGEKQCHSFHQYGDCQDEVDWLRIDNSNGYIGSLMIELDQVTDTYIYEYEYPVEEIIIWDTDLNQIKTSIKSVNRTQIGTKDVYEIDCESSPNDFLIQVVRKENVQRGMYSISLNSSFEVLPTIIADNQLCVDGLLTINNLPDGASVNWTSTANLSLSTNNGITTSIVSTNDLFPDSGYVVFADVNVGGCNYRIHHRFDEVATNNFPTFLNINMEVQGAACDPIFNFSVPAISDATIYEWSCFSENNFDDFTGCHDTNSNYTWGSASLAENEQITINVNLEVSNDCGASIQTSRAFTYTAGDNCDMRSPDFKVDITPNPISLGEQMSISITDESETPIMDYDVIISSPYNGIEYNSNVDQLESQIDINSLSPGIHYLHIISGEKVASKVFVIQN